jgi:hypothetical protein
MTPLCVTAVALEEAELDDVLDLNAAEDKMLQQYACQEENDGSDEC